MPLRWKVFRKVRHALEVVLGKRVTELFVKVKRFIWPEYV